MLTRHQLFLNREETSWSVQQINSTIVYKMGFCCTCMYISWVLQIMLPSPFLYTVLITRQYDLWWKSSGSFPDAGLCLLDIVVILLLLL